MQLNSTSKYAVRILSYIANRHQERLLSAKELSDTLHIPYKFLTKIMTELVKSNFVISIRGRDGGYKLARSAASITIMEILNQFNELTTQDQCVLGIGVCDGNNKCSMHDQWVKPKELMQKMFEETTLENLEGNGSGFKI